METVYDWVTVAIFAGLIVLFVQRSTTEEEAQQHDSLLLYLGAGVGCAVANYVGNKGNAHDRGPADRRDLVLHRLLFAAIQNLAARVAN